MFANYLIGLREGLEAALVVSILIAFVKTSAKPEMQRYIWTGVGLALALSASLGAFFSLSIYVLPEKDEELIAGYLSLIAAVLILGLIYWMSKHSANLKAELQNKAAAALKTSGWALVTVAFVAVAREGIETALFLWSSIVNEGSFATPVLSAVAGIITSIGIVWLMYRGVMKVNIRRFFQITTTLLIFVAAGVASYGVHELQEVGVLPGDGEYLYDISGILGTDSLLGALLNGLFNYNPDPTFLELSSWALILILGFAIHTGVASRFNRKTEKTAEPINV